MQMPIDFRRKVAMPPGIGGKGSPYQISADDLMRNFDYSALDVEPEQDGIQLGIATRDGKRYISAGGGKTGSLVFQDCDGAEIARIDWANGVITTESIQYVETGCTVVSSSEP